MIGLIEQLRAHAQEMPDRVALARRRADGQYEETTWSALWTEAGAFARLLNQRGQQGGIVPLCMAKSASCVAAMMGALGAGCAFTVLNQKLRPPQIAHILRTTGAKIAVIDEAGLMAIKGAVREMPGVVEWVLVRGSGFGGVHQRIVDELALTSKVTEWKVEPGDWPTPAVSQTGCCLFTSGSTGTPKGVLISTKDLEDRARAEVGWYDLKPNDVLLSILPFSFDVGLNQLLSWIVTGSTLVILESWLPRDILKIAAERKVTGISGVPSIWLDFLTHGLSFDTAGVHGDLRYITVSGGDMSAQHLERLPTIVPGRGIFKTYGQTEAFRATSLRPAEYQKYPTSVGRPFAGVNLYIAREDGSRALANEAGEVVHSGLGVMMGYLGGNDPQNKLRDNPFRSAEDTNEKAIFTGDTGMLNEEGYLFLSGRRDDMLKIQGNRVYPAEIRDQMLGIDGISQVEIVPVKRDDKTTIMAFVILQAGATVTSAAIRMAMLGRAPSYMVPDVVHVRESFPRTASGKPDRQAMAAELMAL